MLEYAPMLHVLYYAKNYASIIRQGLVYTSFIGMFTEYHGFYSN